MTLELDTTFTSLSAIDMQTTGAAGFEWFTRLPERAMPGSQQNPMLSLKMMTEGDETFLRVDPDERNVNWTIATQDPATKAGRTWSFGYFEARLRFHQIPLIEDWSSPTAAWASFWLGSPVAWEGPTGAVFPEIDIFEQLAGPDVLAGTVHQWQQNTATGHFYTRHDTDMGEGGLEGWHTFGLRWEKGKISWFLDGVFVQSMTYGANIAPRLGGFTDWIDNDGQAVESLPAGAFTVLDSSRMALILGTGKGAPMDISRVRVWQK